jgi:cell division protein FtsW
MIKTGRESLGTPDWVLLGATLALIALGLMAVYSSSCYMALEEFDDAAYFFKRQLIWLGLGLVAMLAATLFPHRYWMKLSVVVMVGTVIMLIVAAALGVRTLFGSSASPAEVAKLAVVIYIGHWLSSKGDLLRRLPYGLLPFTIMVGAVTGLVMAQPDISEAMVIVMVAVAMFFLAGAHLVQFLIGIGGGIVAFVLVIRQIPSAMDRLQPFLENWRDPVLGSFSQLQQGLLAFGTGGLTGLGPGNGRMKYWWLPLAHTDSIFAVVGEELGLMGCLGFIALFALLTYRGLRISRQAPDLFGGLLAAGITCWIAFQALVNIAVVTGTMPFTGIALPFVSVGGSSLVTCMIGVGIILSISRATQRDRSSA